jgi:hypothetical protein
VFIGRNKEMDFFESKFRKKSGQLLVLYGRRRIGKTELLREFAKDKIHVFYASSECTDRKQLEGFSKRLLNVYRDSEYLKAFEEWADVFEYISSFRVNEKKLIIIDEFPYMVKGNRSIPSILQNIWDEHLKNEHLMIVLCGSSMSFIENEILAEKNPLYGRTTGIYKMNPMKFDDVIRFFPNYSMIDKITAYGILGGIPHYLKQFDDTLSIEENIKENILMKGSTLYSEVEFLMRQELRETSVYNTLISVIALGNTKMNEIYQKSQIDKAKIGVYLNNLINLGIVEREFPVSEKDKIKANVQRGLYKITDNYFKFWYKFMFPNLSELEEGDIDGVYEEYIAPCISEHVSFVFEEVCIQYLKAKNRNNDLPFRFVKIGRWWDKNQEIDIMAFNTLNQYLLGECKWSNEKMKIKVLDGLEEKARISDIIEPLFYLFSKGGFTKELIELATKRDDLILISLDDIEKQFMPVSVQR